MMNNNIEATDKPLLLMEQLWKVGTTLVNSKNEVVFDTIPKYWTQAYEGHVPPKGVVVRLSHSRFYVVRG